MAWVQAIIILLNKTPLRHVLHAVYALGVRRVLATLSQQPGVFCIFGCGSFFEGRSVYGLSDVDLIIVLRDDVQRTDATAREVAHRYERVRRLFPFLGQWHEKEGCLIFLSEVRAGLPIPESFRVRFKQRKLVALCGEPFPSDLCTGSVTTSEVLVELDTLLRVPLLADQRHTRRLTFWQRIFTKFIALTDMLDMAELAVAMRARPELAFLNDNDISLFFRTSQSDKLFSLLLDLSQQLFAAIRSREPHARVAIEPFSPSTIPPEPVRASSTVITQLERSGRAHITTLPSIPIGLAPRLLYFSIDEPIPLVVLRETAYRGISDVRDRLGRKDEVDENFLVSVEGFVFIVTRQPTFVDVVPLDPILFANVYAAVHDGGTAFDMPASVLAEQRATAAQMFRGLAHLYRTHEGWVPKLSFPCIYREDDDDVIENACRILRAFVASGDTPVFIRRIGDLFDHLGQRHPECREFLAALRQYREHLHGDGAAAAPNNIYRCLHQFVWQILSGRDTLTLDAPDKQLGITVGVITRNRAADLSEMLESLTRQRRAPDEVLVVDNGSTDRTAAVLEQFRDRLPIRRQFLAEASIPKARNLVIEDATHDIVSFIDDDCIAEPGWLAAVERGFLRADNVGIVGGWVLHEPAPEPSSVDNYYRVFHHTKP